MTVGEPGAQGAGMTGRHGPGVNTPSLAAVAAATAGFAIELHIPNGGMFAMGMLSAIVATSWLPAWTGGPFGITVSDMGATPMVHIIMAPFTTTCDIRSASGRVLDAALYGERWRRPRVA
jgi:hypothetical protein